MSVTSKLHVKNTLGKKDNIKTKTTMCMKNTMPLSKEIKVPNGTHGAASLCGGRRPKISRNMASIAVWRARISVRVSRISVRVSRISLAKMSNYP
jgi:hypothetical protein